MKNLILKILPIALAVVLLQLAVTTESKAAPPAWGCGSGGTHYVVCYGDTLFSIGRQFGVYPYEIARVNGLANPNWIYAGQVLYIPEGCGNNCGWDWQGCGNNCGGGYHPQPSNWGNNNCGWGCSGSGYNQTGYYYYNNNQNYNYTCGYYNNCY